MADYNKNYMAAYKQYGESMLAGGGGTNLSGAGSSTMQVWNYGNDDQPSGLGAPTTKPKEEKKSENFWDRITNLFTSNDVDVTNVYTPSVNPASVYDSDAFNPAQVEDYVYRAEMSEQTQDMVEQAMGYEKTKLGQLQLLDTRAMTEEEKERLGPLLDLADDISNENITTTELPPIEGEQQSSLMDALMEGQPTAGLMQRPSVFTGQETRIASTLPDWMQALPLEGFSQALIDIREGRIDRETGQPIEQEVDLTLPEAADQELIPTTRGGADVAPEIDTAPPEQTGLMTRRLDGKDGDISESYEDTFVNGFVDLMGEREGTEDHEASEGQFTYAYGITQATADALNIDPADYETRREFAEAVYSEMYDGAKQDYPAVFEDMSDPDKRKNVLSMYINLGRLPTGVENALSGPDKDFQAAGQSLTNVIHYTSRSGPNKGKTFSSKGVSKRRAEEYNDLMGANITQVQVIGPRNNPTFNWIDANGNIVESYTSNKPLSPDNTLGTVSVN